MSVLISLVGLLLPPFIDLINRKIKDSDKRFWVSVAFCVVVGAMLQVASGGGTTEAYFESMMAVFGLAQLSYKAVYENSVIQEKIR